MDRQTNDDSLHKQQWTKANLRCENNKDDSIKYNNKIKLREKGQVGVVALAEN